MSDNVHYLPGAESEPRAGIIDQLKQFALDQGWVLVRSGPTWLIVTRVDPQVERTEQITVSLVGGDLRASKVLVLGTETTVDAVTGWMMPS